MAFYIAVRPYFTLKTKNKNLVYKSDNTINQHITKKKWTIIKYDLPKQFKNKTCTNSKSLNSVERK